jgi:hypothetical protein
MTILQYTFSRYEFWFGLDSKLERKNCQQDFAHFSFSSQVAKGRFRLPTSARYGLCITLPLQNSATGVPRLHSLKARSENEFIPKKSWPLKNVQAIEGSNRNIGEDEGTVRALTHPSITSCSVLFFV